MEFRGVSEKGMKYVITQTTENPTVVKISNFW